MFFDFFSCESCQQMASVTYSKGEIVITRCGCEEFVPLDPIPSPF